jgi:ribulose 1,5-bisphosphate synthetase/thiazole synthase
MSHVLRAVSKNEVAMAQNQGFDVVTLGTGQGGKHVAWNLGRSGTAVAVVARR